jgi:hypothetical protein
MQFLKILSLCFHIEFKSMVEFWVIWLKRGALNYILDDLNVMTLIANYDATPKFISSRLPWSAVCCFSRVTSSANIKIFSGQGPDEYMRNVIYREVLEM